MAHTTVETPPGVAGVLKPLAQQVVVIMGASSGIGRETARQMAGRGARLVVAARDSDALASLVAEVKEHGGEATAVTADTSNIDEVRVVADTAVERYGGLDTWVQAAAVALFARFEQTTVEEFRRVVDVNLLGHVNAAMVALPHLRRRGAALSSRSRSWRPAGPSPPTRPTPPRSTGSTASSKRCGSSFARRGCRSA